MSVRSAGGFVAANGSPGDTRAETIDRFCRTCTSFHGTRSRLLPGEAVDLVPPACYFRGRLMPPGWCVGSAYQEDIP